MTDYSRQFASPSREEIAARVAATEPAVIPVPPAAPPSALQCFATHLAARMRLLRWDQAQLMEHAGIKTPQIAARAINGTGCDIALAETIAGIVGMDVSDMLQPYVCGTCHGEPPAGFSCLECGAEGERRAS